MSGAKSNTIWSLAAIALAFGLGFLLTHSGTKKPPCLGKAGTSHMLALSDDSFTPASFSGRQCDLMFIINQSSRDRLVAFGPHDHHIVYNGVDERLLKPNESLTITLDQTGTFRIHDHNNPSVSASFTVTGR